MRTAHLLFCSYHCPFWHLTWENYTVDRQKQNKLIPAECMRCHCLWVKGEIWLSWHVSHHVKVNTVTQPSNQMGLHVGRVRPVTELKTVGEIELSAQRLDLEGKHSKLLYDSGKSRTLVKYKCLIFTERALTPCVLRVFVWFMRRMPQWNILTRFTLTPERLVSSFQCPLWFIGLAWTCAVYVRTFF